MEQNAIYAGTGRWSTRQLPRGGQMDETPSAQERVVVHPKFLQMCGANCASKMSPVVRCEWCIQICQDVRCEWCGSSLPGGRPLKATDHQLSMDVAAKLLSDLRPIQSCFFVLATRTANERTTTYLALDPGP